MILSYQGNDIEQREVDGYVNLTQMAKPFNKRVSDWSRSESAKAYLEATSIVTGICVSELLLQTTLVHFGENNHPRVVLAIIGCTIIGAIKIHPPSILHGSVVLTIGIS